MSRDELTVIDAMAQMGGSFIRGLASLYCVADPDNRKRIRETWPDEWATYTAYAKDAERGIE
jgi:hypothetical protein